MVASKVKFEDKLKAEALRVASLLMSSPEKADKKEITAKVRKHLKSVGLATERYNKKAQAHNVKPGNADKKRHLKVLTPAAVVNSFMKDPWARDAIQAAEKPVRKTALKVKAKDLKPPAKKGLKPPIPRQKKKTIDLVTATVNVVHGQRRAELATLREQAAVARHRTSAAFVRQAAEQILSPEQKFDKPIPLTDPIFPVVQRHLQAVQQKVATANVKIAAHNQNPKNAKKQLPLKVLPLGAVVTAVRTELKAAQAKPAKPLNKEALQKQAVTAQQPKPRPVSSERQQRKELEAKARQESREKAAREAAERKVKLKKRGLPNGADIRQLANQVLYPERDYDRPLPMQGELAETVKHHAKLIKKQVKAENSAIRRYNKRAENANRQKQSKTVTVGAIVEAVEKFLRQKRAEALAAPPRPVKAFTPPKVKPPKAPKPAKQGAAQRKTKRLAGIKKANHERPDVLQVLAAYGPTETALLRKAGQAVPAVVAALKAQRVGSLPPRVVRQTLRFAHSLYEHEKPTLALNTVAALRTRNPKDRVVQFALAQYAAAAGDAPLAERNYRQLLETPLHNAALERMVTLRVETARPAAALKLLNRHSGSTLTKPMLKLQETIASKLGEITVGKGTPANKQPLPPKKMAAVKPALQAKEPSEKPPKVTSFNPPKPNRPRGSPPPAPKRVRRPRIEEVAPKLDTETPAMASIATALMGPPPPPPTPASAPVATLPTISRLAPYPVHGSAAEKQAWQLQRAAFESQADGIPPTERFGIVAGALPPNSPPKALQTEDIRIPVTLPPYPERKHMSAEDYAQAVKAFHAARLAAEEAARDLTKTASPKPSVAATEETPNTLIAQRMQAARVQSRHQSKPA